MIDDPVTNSQPKDGQSPRIVSVSLESCRCRLLRIACVVSRLLLLDTLELQLAPPSAHPVCLSPPENLTVGSRSTHPLPFVISMVYGVRNNEFHIQWYNAGQSLPFIPGLRAFQTFVCV